MDDSATCSVPGSRAGVPVKSTTIDFQRPVFTDIYDGRVTGLILVVAVGATVNGQLAILDIRETAILLAVVCGIAQCKLRTAGD